MDKVRIDKWLWAARFFKTCLAKNAIENGKVQVDGQKPKPSRTLEVGVTLNIRQGFDEKLLKWSPYRINAEEPAGSSFVSRN